MVGKEEGENGEEEKVGCVYYVWPLSLCSCVPFLFISIFCIWSNSFNFSSKKKNQFFFYK